MAKKEADLAWTAAELAAKVADHLADLAELKALFSSPGDDEMEGCYADGTDAAWAAKASAYRARWCAKYCSPRSYPPGADFRSPSKCDHDREQSAQCHLLRDIFGNPFRGVSIDPAWLAWNGGTLVRLAQAAYDDRQLPAGTLDPARLNLLADALEGAGCTNAEILTHLRSPGPHVRGCWAVDLVVNKE